MMPCATLLVHAPSPPLKVVKAPGSIRLYGLRRNESIRQYKFIDELCAEVELAIVSNNVKCQRRALRSGLRTAEETRCSTEP